MKVDEEFTNKFDYQFSREELVEILLSHVEKEKGKKHTPGAHGTRIEVRGDAKEISTGLSLIVTERGQKAYDTKNSDVPRQVKWKEIKDTPA